MHQLKENIVDYLNKEGYEVLHFNGIEENNNSVELAIKVEVKDLPKWQYFVSRVNGIISNRDDKRCNNGGCDANKSKRCDESNQRRIGGVKENYSDGILNFIFTPETQQDRENITEDIIEKRLSAFLEALHKKYYTVSPKENNFTVICKVTHRCNLDCKYCYDKPHRGVINSDMSMETYEQILKLASNYTRSLTLIYHGGEPTILGREWYEKVHKEIVPKYPMLDIKFCIMTNGVLLNDEWYEMLERLDIGPGISYNANYQEQLRVASQELDDTSKDAKISDIVLNSIKNEKFKGGIIDVITKQNYKSIIDIYKFYQKLNHSVVMSPVFNSSGTEENDLQLPVEDYIEEWKKFFKYWLYDVDGVDERTCKQMILHLAGDRKVLCENIDCRGKWIGVNPIGQVFPCGRYYPDEHSFGPISEFESVEKIFECEGYKTLREDYDARIETHCKNCDYYPMCSGGCPNTHYIYTGSRRKNDPNQCKLFQMQFKAAYEIVRDLDLTRDKLNPVAKRVLVENGFYSVKEIRRILDEVGINIPFEYDPNNLTKCSEYEVFRGVNYMKNESCTFGRHVDFIESDEEEAIATNDRNRKKDLLVFFKSIAENVVSQMR